MSATLPVGIHDGVPMQAYLLHHGLSASRIHTLLQYSPFHAYHDEGGEPSEASEMGVAIHDALLEGVDRIVPLAFDDYKKQAARDARDEARAKGKIPMLERKVSQVMQAVDAAKRYVASSEIAGVFERGRPEQTVIWNELYDSAKYQNNPNLYTDKRLLTCKARPDWLTDERDLILHVKTTQGSAEPNAWIRNMLTSMGYDIAASFYERGIEMPLASRSVFLVIEANPPYGCSLIGLDPAMADLAARKVERAIKTWQQCKATGVYPCYPTRICYAEPRPWQLAEEEETKLTGAYDALQEKEGLQA